MSFEFVHSVSGFFEKNKNTNTLHPIKEISINEVIVIAGKIGVRSDKIFKTTGPFDFRQSIEDIESNKKKLGIILSSYIYNSSDELQEHIDLLHNYFSKNQPNAEDFIRYINKDMYNQDMIYFNLYDGCDPNLMKSFRSFDGFKGFPADHTGMVGIIRREAIYVHLPLYTLKNYDFLYEMKRHFGDEFCVSSCSRPGFARIGGFIIYSSQLKVDDSYLTLEKLDWKRSFLNLGHFQFNSLRMLLQPVSYRNSFDHQQVKSLLEGEQEDSAFLEAIMWGEEHVRLPWREPFVEKSARYALKLRALTGCDILIGDHPLRPHDIEPFLAGPFVRGKHY